MAKGKKITTWELPNRNKDMIKVDVRMRDDMFHVNHELLESPLSNPNLRMLRAETLIALSKTGSVVEWEDVVIIRDDWDEPGDICISTEQEEVGKQDGVAVIKRFGRTEKLEDQDYKILAMVKVPEGESSYDTMDKVDEELVKIREKYYKKIVADVAKRYKPYDG